MTPERILKRPIFLTEKASLLREQNKVVFEVSRDANKIQIRDAVQKIFGVTVTSVHTMIFRGKERRMGRGHAKLQNWKKAVISLKPGDTIKFFDEEEAEATEQAEATGDAPKGESTQG
jgi:large subunit ribosomal protein L23